MGRKTLIRDILLLCICIYILWSVFIDKTEEGFQTDGAVELVVARYKENLDWLTPYDDGTFSKITVYNKSTTPVEYKSDKARVRIETLPNVGVCDHTYLYHIIENYYDLADTTVFIPGSGYLPYKKELIEFTIGKVKETKDTVIPIYPFDVTLGEAMYNLTIDNYTLSTNENRDTPNEEHTPAKIRPFGKWYQTYFGDAQVKKGTFIGIFAASREDIRSRDKEFYQELLSQVATDKFHETSHYIERSWSAIFKSVKDSSLYDHPVHQQRIGVNTGGCKYLRR
jgi:hypothetical protein